MSDTSQPTGHMGAARAPFRLAELVSVPRGDGSRMILLERHARLLASGGVIDPDRGAIFGGDPAHDGYPAGSRPLSKKEIAMIVSHHQLAEGVLWSFVEAAILVGGLVGGLLYLAHLIWGWPS